MPSFPATNITSAAASSGPLSSTRALRYTAPMRASSAASPEPYTAIVLPSSSPTTASAAATAPRATSAASVFVTPSGSRSASVNPVLGRSSSAFDSTRGFTSSMNAASAVSRPSGFALMPADAPPYCRPNVANEYVTERASISAESCRTLGASRATPAERSAASRSNSKKPSVDSSFCTRTAGNPKRLRFRRPPLGLWSRARRTPRLPADAEPRPAGGGDPPRRTPAGDRRRRFGQDPGPHPPHRPPDPGPRHQPVRDPRHHLHQQGGRGDEAAGRGPRGSGRREDVGLDLPLRVRPHPAPRRRQARLPVELHDLRPGRRGAP